jgi:hypothetical protein
VIFTPASSSVTNRSRSTRRIQRWSASRFCRTSGRSCSLGRGRFFFAHNRRAPWRAESSSRSCAGPVRLAGYMLGTTRRSSHRVARGSPRGGGRDRSGSASRHPAVAAPLIRWPDTAPPIARVCDTQCQTRQPTRCTHLHPIRTPRPPVRETPRHMVLA